MINRKEMMPLLVQVCPTYEESWETFLEEWKEDFLGLPYYVALADFARHLIALLEEGDDGCFSAVFEQLETFLQEGEPYVKEAITVGLFEALQNGELYENAEPSQFETYLLPESKLAWVDAQDLETDD